LRRPKRSLSVPPKAAPRTQPASSEEAANSVWNSVSANCCFRKSKAPLMTAISKPKSRPEVAATSEASET